MKKYFGLLMMIVVSTCIVFASTNGPIINFKQKNLTHDFGKVALNEKAEYYFEFTNDGNKPLIIMDVQSTCGCTTPEYSKLPVLPGKSDKIKVGYKTDKSGPINRQISVKTNAGDYTLKILGEVK